MTTEATATKQADQLVLVPVEGNWRIDDDTRRIGRVGIARARAALAANLQAPGNDETLQLAA